METTNKTLKKLELLNLFGAFLSLTKKQTPIKFCAARNHNDLTEIQESISSEMEALHKDHVKIDNTSEPVFLPEVKAQIDELTKAGKQIGTPAPGWYEYKDGKEGLERYYEAIQKLNDEEIEVTIHTVKLSDKRSLVDPKGERPLQELTVEELIEDPNSPVAAELPLLLKYGVLTD